MTSKEHFQSYRPLPQQQQSRLVTNACPHFVAVTPIPSSVALHSLVNFPESQQPEEPPNFESQRLDEAFFTTQLSCPYPALFTNVMPVKSSCGMVLFQKVPNTLC